MIAHLSRILRSRRLAREVWAYWNPTHLGPDMWWKGGRLPATTFSSPAKWLHNERRGLILPYAENSMPSDGAAQEPAAENKHLRSADFAHWSATNGITVPTTKTDSPDGSNNAEILLDGAGGCSPRQDFTGTATVWCASGWIRARSLTNFEVVFYSVVSGYATPTCRILQGPGTASVSGNNARVAGLSTTVWTRFEVKATLTAQTWRMYTYPKKPDWNPSVIGDTIDSWGWQIEVGPFATSYIPTAGAAVTRTADALRWVSADVFGPLAAQGSMVLVQSMPYSSNSGGTAATVYTTTLNNGDAFNDVVSGYMAPTGGSHISNQMRSGGADQQRVSAASAGAFVAGAPFVAVQTWAASGEQRWYVGTYSNTASGKLSPAALDRLEVQSYGSAGIRSGGQSHAILLFDRPLTAAEACAITADPRRLAA